MEDIKNELFICDCHSTEHLIIFRYFTNDDDDDGNVYLHVHLSPDAGFWTRFGRAIKYLFGHRTKYGDFDEFIFNPDDVNKLQNIVDYLKIAKINKDENRK